MNANSVLILTVSVSEDWFSLGRCWEDGTDLVHSRYSVRVEDVKTGRRWLHFKHFNMTHDCHGPMACTEDEEGCRSKQEFQSDDQAGDDCRKLAAKVAAAYKAWKWAGPIGNENWVEVDACYGSEAYQAQGVEAREAYLERRENERAY
jgi:hypothetical protein